MICVINLCEAGPPSILVVAQIHRVGVHRALGPGVHHPGASERGNMSLGTHSSYP